MAKKNPKLGDVVEVWWNDAPNERGIVVERDRYSLSLLMKDTKRATTEVERDQVVAVHGNVLDRL